MKRKYQQTQERWNVSCRIQIDGDQPKQPYRLRELTSPNASDHSVTEWCLTLNEPIENLLCVRMYNGESEESLCGFNVSFPSALSDNWIPESCYDASYMHYRVLPQCTLRLSRHRNQQQQPDDDDDDSATDQDDDDELRVYFVMEQNAPEDGGWMIACDEAFWFRHYGSHIEVDASGESTLDDLYVPLDFYSPDPYLQDEDDDGAEIPIEKRLQRRYHWFELRANTEHRVSGSTTTSLLGFYPKSDIDDRARKRMARGRAREIDVLFTVMHAWGDRLETVEEVGTYIMRGHRNIHSTPDALAYFKPGRMRPPRWVVELWHKNPISSVGVAYADMPLERAVLEFKVSYGDDQYRPSTKFSPYYIPQLYMEMMATDSRSAYLIRYSPTLNRAHAYHIWRDPVVEKNLLDILVMRRQLGEDGLVKLRATRQFKQRCIRFADWYNVKNKKPPRYEVLDVPLDTIQQYHQWQASLQYAPSTGNTHENNRLLSQIRACWVDADALHKRVQQANTSLESMKAHRDLIDDGTCAQLVSLYARIQRLQAMLR